jgi:hypothetical protein
MFWTCTQVCRSASSRNDFVVIEETPVLQKDGRNTERLPALQAPPSETSTTEEKDSCVTSLSERDDEDTASRLQASESLQTQEKDFCVTSSTECGTQRTVSLSQASETLSPGPVLLTSRSICSEKQKSAPPIAEVRVASVAGLPNFSGKWVMNNVEGDMEQLLADAGVSWALRKMAKGVNWGIGKNFQEISQNGNEFVIVHKAPMNTTTMRFQVGSGYQETVGVDGKPILCDATWDEQSLIIMCKTQAGKEHAPARRYLEDGCMVIEAKTSNGQVVRRFFAKH